MKHRWIAGVMTIVLAMEMAAAQATPAYAKLAEQLTVQDGQFIRANGTAVEGALAKGVSVSKYQNRAGEIDWQRVADDGVSFAMIRLGYNNDIDPYFHENMLGALQHGIRTGVFLYTQATDVETARQEAQFALSMVRDYPVSYPIAYDVESQYLLDMGKTPQEIADQANAFCEVIAQAGYRPVIYANNLWLTEHVDASRIPYDIWYARYETSVNEFPNRTIWQYTDAGTVDGITGDVCIEIAFADYSQLFPGTGWRQILGSWYYYQDYQKQTGWLQVGELWYYLNEDGTMAANTTLTIDGNVYSFGEDGVWQN